MTVHKCGGCLKLVAAVFLTACCAPPMESHTTPPAIQVELNLQKPLHLRVTLRSGAATTISISRYELPWGWRYSIVFAAAKPNGEAVDLILPVDDPGLVEMTVKPGETLTGDIDLRYVIAPNALKKSDVLLFWAYKAPAALHIPRWSGGLVVIPQQR